MSGIVGPADLGRSSRKAVVGVAILLALLWLGLAPVYAGDGQARMVRGRVVDAAGKPVAGVAIAWFWSANGIPRDDDGTPWPSDQAGFGKRIKEQGWEKMSEQVGTMEPQLLYPNTVTDAEGQFSITAHSASDALLAMDQSRRRGALVDVDRKTRKLSEPIALRKLVRVHGKLAISDSDARPKWTNMYALFKPDIKRRPLDVYRVISCSSFDANFSFLVPPGTYTLDVYSTDPESRIRRGIKLEVDGSQAEVDLGTAALVPETFFLTSRIRQWEVNGTRGDFKQHMGRAPPEWFISDARGAGKDVQIADYRGKWVVLEFWSLSCKVCLKHDLPQWAKFYKQHRQMRDRFEILSIYVDVDENLESIAQVEKRLKPIVEFVWKGQILPFPMLLDSGLKTWHNFGLNTLGQTLLVDPEGNLTAVIGHKEVYDYLANELDSRD